MESKNLEILTLVAQEDLSEIISKTVLLIFSLKKSLSIFKANMASHLSL